ncbi:MAG: sigma-70 family RNA polymerase sigma factor [Chloroflexi bacterium]|nr:sigma-70 family RNA polymerase sigma factor [Chloroflexota bacterium]
MRSEPTTGFSACWELFHRAVVENDEQAWQALYVQYRRLIGKWGTGIDLELDDLVTVAFGRFWRALHDQNFANRLPTMKAVMGFLRACVWSEATDRQRRREYQNRIHGELAQAVCETDAHLDPERQILSRERQDYLYSRLQDEDEQLVFQLSWELNLKPREIATQYPQRFVDARSVSRIKERIMRRLSEDPMVQEWRTL